jgi:hypothetical protein
MPKNRTRGLYAAGSLKDRWIVHSWNSDGEGDDKGLGKIRDRNISNEILAEGEGANQDYY